MFRRLLLGLVKGLVIGGAIGALMQFALGVPLIPAGVLSYLFFGGIAALAGVAAGQPPWREGAWVGSILKALFGFAVGASLYWVAQRFLNFPIGGLAGLPADAHFAQAPLTFAPALGAVFSMLIELDDGGDQASDSKTGVRVDAAGSSKKKKNAADDADDEVEAKPAARAKK
ncbi:MAG: hypothetical protein WCJ30_19600 [Deltaproteobacteria bacterium]